MKFSMTWQEKGDFLIQVTWSDHMGRFDCISYNFTTYDPLSGINGVWPLNS